MPATLRLVMFAAATLIVSGLCLTQPSLGEDPSAPMEHPTPPPPSPLLDRMRALAGDWEGANPEHHEGMPDKIAVNYRVTSNGSVVVETFMAGTPHEMITVYYVDGDKLVLTHYCALGNQPMMTAEEPKAADAVRFVCHGGGNLPDEKVAHMHEVTHEFLGPDHLRSSWVMLSDGKPAGATAFDLHRVQQ